MYKIKGADNNEYGPISADQVRQWIRENRLSRVSLAENVDAPGWKPLGEYPEFADVLVALGAIAAMPATAAGTTTGSREEALAAVKGPAIALMIAGWLQVALALWGIISLIFGIGKARQEDGMKQMAAMPDGAFKDYMMKFIEILINYEWLLNILGLALGLLFAVGALKMLRLTNKALVWTAVIIGLIPCLNGCCCLTIPFGIWALVVLNKPAVRDNFS